MTSISIPYQWLTAKKKPGDWTFQCTTDLPNLVETHRAAVYFKKIVTFLEEENNIVDYHFKLRHNDKRNNQLDVCIYFDNPKRIKNPTPLPTCLSCEADNEIAHASLLDEYEHHRTWLDGRARTKLIVTPIRHVERLIDLTDEEMETYWKIAVDLIQREANVSIASYPNLILNHGAYRHFCHLHLKINFTEDLWQKTVVIRREKQIQSLKELCKNTEMVRECFGNSAVKKK